MNSMRTAQFKPVEESFFSQMNLVELMEAADDLNLLEGWDDALIEALTQEEDESIFFASKVPGIDMRSLVNKNSGDRNVPALIHLLDNCQRHYNENKNGLALSLANSLAEILIDFGVDVSLYPMYLIWDDIDEEKFPRVLILLLIVRLEVYQKKLQTEISQCKKAQALLEDQLAESSSHIMIGMFSDIKKLVNQDPKSQLGIKIPQLAFIGELLKRLDDTDISGKVGSPIVLDYIDENGSNVKHRINDEQAKKIIESSDSMFSVIYNYGAKKLGRFPDVLPQNDSISNLLF